MSPPTYKRKYDDKDSDDYKKKGGYMHLNVWTYALMPRGISVHTYSGYVHIWSFTPYVWTLKITYLSNVTTI